MPRIDILELYEKLRGKSLHLRFPFTLPTDLQLLERNVKTICSRVIKVRRPRQKKKTFCLIDFATKEDRSLALEELKNVTINGIPLQVKTPITEDKEFLEKIIKTRAEREARIKLRKDLKRELRRARLREEKYQNKPYTNTIYVGNVPFSATTFDLRDLFPNAIDINIKASKDAKKPIFAFVTLPTPEDAFKATKNRNYKIGENKLRVAFAGLNRTKTEGSNKSIDENGIKSNNFSQNDVESKEGDKGNNCMFYISNEKSTENEENLSRMFPKVSKKRQTILGLSETTTKPLGNNKKRKPHSVVGISANLSKPMEPPVQNSAGKKKFDKRNTKTNKEKSKT